MSPKVVNLMKSSVNDADLKMRKIRFYRRGNKAVQSGIITAKKIRILLNLEMIFIKPCLDSFRNGGRTLIDERNLQARQSSTWHHGRA